MQQHSDNVVALREREYYRTNEPLVEPEEAELDDSDELISLESDNENKSENKCDKVKKNNHFPKFGEDREW